MAQDFGQNVELNRALAAATGFTGDFGGGNYRRFLEQADPETRAISDAILRRTPGFADFQFDTRKGGRSDRADFAYVPPQGRIQPYPMPSMQDVELATQAGQAGLMSGQEALRTGQAGLQTGITGLETGQAGLQAGQADLAAGQTGLATGQAGLATGIGEVGTAVGDVSTQLTGVGTQVADVGTRVEGVGAAVGDVQTGVTGLGAAIGAPAEGDPRTLFAGQAGLMAGQTQLGEQIGGGVDRLTGEITNVGADLTALQRASDAYQREAQRQRTLAAQAGQTGREQLQRQVAGVGQQANRLAEAQAAQRLAATPRGMMQMGTGGAPTAGPQLAAQTAQAAQQGFRPPAQGVPAPVSPLGPQAQDPRDLVTQLQQLQAQQAGLMAQLGI